MSSVRLAALAALACAALGAGAAHAQVYRIVGPDGRVTFSDRPPEDGRGTPAQTLSIPGASGGTPVASLPMEVRDAANRYPVTLYTGNDCAPCTTARNFLAGRGIPFSERTVTTAEDIAALQRLSGANRLPFATIGGQHLVGFTQSEWSQYLDAAGYPKTSQLPPNYRNPAASPLVAVRIPPKAEPAPAPARAEGPAPTPGASPSNPAGIRF